MRHRVLRSLSRHGLLNPDDARDMLAWDNGGFSLDASVRIAGHNRAGLEPLLRYCARPRFAVRFAGDSRQCVGNYQGQLLAGQRPSTGRLAPGVREGAVTDPKRTLALCTGTAAIRRIAATARIVALLTEAAPVRRIINHIGKPAEPPRISPAPGPPAWDAPPVAAVPNWDARAQPQPESVFDQKTQWHPLRRWHPPLTRHPLHPGPGKPRPQAQPAPSETCSVPSATATRPPSARTRPSPVLATRRSAMTASADTSRSCSCGWIFYPYP